MTDDELRGWISDDRRHGVHINAGTLSDLAAEVLRLRAKEAAGEKLAEALKNWLSALNNLVAFEADNPNNSTKEWSGLVDALEAAENTAPDALAAWEDAK